MRAAVAAVLGLLPTFGLGARILQGNDDGWAEQYVRVFNDVLVAAGHDVVLSCPAENQSGTGSNDAPPADRTAPCQYDSCAANSGPVGHNATNPRLNWVNSFPVTAVKYGIDTFGRQFWDGADPELVVTGPNVGMNAWLVQNSGTVGAAVEAVLHHGIPAVAFSGASTGTLRWDTVPVPTRSTLYAELAGILVEQLLAARKSVDDPILPPMVWLNVNFPWQEGSCQRVEDFKWVLTRINPWIFSQPDVEHCGTDRLPRELETLLRLDCSITVSVGDAQDKTTASADKQAIVLEKLGSLFTCL